MVKLNLLLLALPLVAARMRGVSREAEEKFPVARQLQMGGGGGGGCPDAGVSRFTRYLKHRQSSLLIHLLFFFA
jgi:hypothetical protein